MRMRTLILFGLIFWLVLYGMSQIENFLGSDLFKIKKIEIHGNYSILQEDIVDKLMLLKDRGVWFINVKKVEEAIKKDVRINDVKIRLQIPDKAFVYIEEREAYTNIMYKNKIFVADRNGIIFAKRLEFNSKDMLILNIEDEKDIESFYLELSKIDDNLKSEISEIYGSKEKINLVLKDGVIIKSKEDLEKKKYEVAYKLYLKLKEQGKDIDYIDLRFQDYIVK